MKKHMIAISMILFILPSSILAEGLISESPENAEVYFIQPVDGQTVKGKVNIVFGLKNMGIAPAGTDRKNTGHHHLLIDTDVLPDLAKPLPSNDKTRHFGGGQSETEIELSPGKHTLQLILGNYAHVPHKKPVVSSKITITVE
ncbi:rod shape-determining protein RodA [Gammaproteobacteria bacterium 45_16_T64]|nr:rod shape-determining protein RodA [Gammaproteobacteria bacterium 45_16_T64]